MDNSVYESETHDYKGDIPDSTALTELCCSFANSPRGGFVVLGIDKRFRIVGIENNTELPREFGKKIRAIPTLNPPLPKVIRIPDSTKILAVFHIPFNEEGPHVPIDEQRRIFWKRTNKGKDYMTYEEIKMAFQRVPYEERKQHSLYLNDIFKKLSAVGYTTKYDKTISLEVPDDYQNYRANMFFGFGFKRPEGLPQIRWVDIKYLNHLENALSHLRYPEYADKYQSWQELNKLVSEYNHIIKSTVSTLVGAIERHMKHDYPSFSDAVLHPHEQVPDSYHSKNIFDFIFRSYIDYIIDKVRTDFDKLEIVSNDVTKIHKIVFKGSNYLGDGIWGIDEQVFVQASGKEKLDAKKMGKTLEIICKEPDTLKSFSNLQDKTQEIYNVRVKFRKQLESLTKDIDAGYTIKGSCSFGF